MCVPGDRPEDLPDALRPGAAPAEGPPGAPFPDSQRPVVPSSVTGALAMAEAALGWLATADLAGVPVAVQADCLRSLEKVASKHAAARAAAVSAFTASRGFEADGQYSAKAWLRWQSRTTSAAAGQVVAMARRLDAHRAIAGALAAGELSVSWARQIADWTDLLPEGTRVDADAILLAAAAGGADLSDLGALFEQIRRRVAAADKDKDGFEDRWLRLGVTFRGSGRLDGGLTPRCAAALAAVLESLGKWAGPEDTRSQAQRDHDALEEALRRLLAAGCLPDRAGQPVQLQLHLTLDQLLGLTGATGAGPGGAAGGGGPGAGGRCCGQPAAAPGDECDATIVPVVTGRVDHGLLDHLAAALTGQASLGGRPGPAAPGAAGGLRGTGVPGTGICSGPHACMPAADPAAHPAASHAGCGDPDQCAAERWQALSEESARALILHHAIALLSGPDALAAYLRTGILTGPAASISLPLDIGAAADTIPAHLRRAVIARDRHCRFPGCRQKPAACQIHHLIPRARGGSTRLGGLVLLCAFHHLIAIHQWGWKLTLNADGTTSATSPDGLRAYNSHGPPAAA